MHFSKICYFYHKFILFLDSRICTILVQRNTFSRISLEIENFLNRFSLFSWSPGRVFFNNLSFSVNPTNIFLRDHAILTLTICHSAFLNRVGKVLFCWMLARVPTRDIIKLVSQKYCNFVCWRKLKFCSLTNVCEKYDLFSRKCKTNPFRGNPTAPNHNVPFRPGRELIFLIQCVISTTIQRTVGSPYGSTHTHQRESRKQGAGSGEEKQGAGSGEEKQGAGSG